MTRGATNSGKSEGLQIRERGDADFEQLEILALQVQASDRYPIYLPDGDVRRFLSQPASTAAWVAVFDDQVVGHVALNDSTSAPVMMAVDELGDDRPALYVARLLVAPSARRTGAGRALLDHARRQAASTGFLPALDVVDISTAAPAIALYRSEGWQEIARVSFELADLHLEEIVFVAPAG